MLAIFVVVWFGLVWFFHFVLFWGVWVGFGSVSFQVSLGTAFDGYCGIWIWDDRKITSPMFPRSDSDLLAQSSTNSSNKSGSPQRPAPDISQTELANTWEQVPSFFPDATASKSAASTKTTIFYQALPTPVPWSIKRGNLSRDLGRWGRKVITEAMPLPLFSLLPSQ